MMRSMSKRLQLNLRLSVKIYKRLQVGKGWANVGFQFFKEGEMINERTGSDLKNT